MTETSTKTLTLLVGLTLIVSIMSLYVISNLDNKFDIVTGGAANNPNGAGNQPTQEPTARVEGDLTDDDAVLGNKNAPVTIVEFSDFECPFCKRFYLDAEPKIITEYVNTGKVKMIYRDFPLSDKHPNAQKAGEATECAEEQNKFWEMHDLLFEKGVVGGVTTFKQYASELKLDTKKFDECLDSGKYQSEVAKDMSDGTKYGVTGTPAFFINGWPLVGAQPFEAFKVIIDQELNK